MDGWMDGRADGRAHTQIDKTQTQAQNSEGLIGEKGIDFFSVSQLATDGDNLGRNYLLVVVQIHVAGRLAFIAETCSCGFP